MKKRTVQLLLGFGMSLAVIGTTVPCFAADETATESETAVETVVESESETETEAETESDFVEGSALLSDYSYVKGELTKDGWKSDFLKMEYVPEENVTIGIDENAKMEEYYGRNGDDKKVADSEMVALDSDGGYVQLSAEVNPNHESEEDILERFKAIEKLDLTGKNKEVKIAGKTFLTSSGVIDKERYLIGVSTDQDNMVLAIKVKFKDTDAKKVLLKGFTELKEDTDTAETESETELPEEFAESEEITEAATEDATEAAK